MDYKFDFNKFIHRKRMKQKDAATMVGVSIGLVGTWASGKALPSYEKVVKLIECGISAQELFGESFPFCTNWQIPYIFPNFFTTKNPFLT